MRAAFLSLLSGILTVACPWESTQAQSLVLGAAVLPGSRAVAVNGTATAFATVINAGDTTALGCGIALPASIAGMAVLSYQTTNPQTNAVTGTADTPVSIAPGAAQTFVLSVRPTAVFPQNDIALQFTCASGQAAMPVSGVNTFLLASSAEPTPDVVALAATVSGNGIVRTAGVAPAAFSVAAVNVGTAGSLRVSAQGLAAAAGAGVSICETNAAAACLQDPAPLIYTTMDANATATFSVFVAGSGTPVALLPAENRVVVRFQPTRGGVVYGATSVALQIDP